MPTGIRDIARTTLVDLISWAASGTSVYAQAAEGSGSGVVGSGALQESPSDAAKPNKAEAQPKPGDRRGTDQAPANNSGPSPSTNPE